MNAQYLYLLFKIAYKTKCDSLIQKQSWNHTRFFFFFSIFYFFSFLEYSCHV